MASLLTQGDKFFWFQHEMDHRKFLGAMSPLTRFSLLPYFLDPYPSQPGASKRWRLVHGQAHLDFINALPSWPGSRGATGWPHGGVGLPTHQPLVDPDVKKPTAQKWFDLANHQEHLQANGSIAFETFVFPFW